MSADATRINLKNAKPVSITSREDFVDLLRSGRVVVLDSRTGKYVKSVMGVDLPDPEEAIENALALGLDSDDEL